VARSLSLSRVLRFLNPLILHPLACHYPHFFGSNLFNPSSSLFVDCFAMPVEAPTAML
jgi:hypothetical protein